MSLYISSLNPVPFVHQASQLVQTYHPVSSDSSLDPITAQIVKSHDAALEVMQQIENGAAARFWEAQKKLPSATWLGNLIDWFLGWGKYHPESEMAEPRQKRALMSYDCPNIPYGDIVRAYINTSYEIQKYPNNSCLRLDPQNYWTQFYPIIVKPVGSDDVICRIAACIKERLYACYPDCLPCQNATETEKNDMLNTTSDLFWLSTFDKDLMWVYLVQTSIYTPNRTTLNAWKLNQIYKLFNSTRLDCENQFLHPSALQGLYTLLIIPVAVAGGVIYVACKRKQANPTYEQLESAENNA